MMNQPLIFVGFAVLRLAHESMFVCVFVSRETENQGTTPSIFSEQGTGAV